MNQKINKEVKINHEDFIVMTMIPHVSLTVEGTFMTKGLLRGALVSSIIKFCGKNGIDIELEITDSNIEGEKNLIIYCRKTSLEAFDKKNKEALKVPNINLEIIN